MFRAGRWARGEEGLGVVGGLGVRIYEWSERGLEVGVWG